MSEPDYRLDLDRTQPETLREQARRAIEAAIRSARPGFRLGERLTILRLARLNPLHRNTLAHAMDDLVRMGYLRRLPNRGFDVVERTPDRPARLTRHMLSLIEVAERNGLLTCSQVIRRETGLRRAGALKGPLARVAADLDLHPGDQVGVLARTRLMRRNSHEAWKVVAIEQSVLPTALVPDFLETARQEIAASGDFSVYRTLRRTFPHDEFFKAHYEISLTPLPGSLRAYWTSPNPPMNVLTVTYCSQGPVELTNTWFDAGQAVLLAGSLDVEMKAGRTPARSTARSLQELEPPRYRSRIGRPESIRNRRLGQVG